MKDDEDDDDANDDRSRTSDKITKLSRYSSVTEMNTQVFQFFTENFSRKECTMFEPPPQNSKCVCGGEIKDHRLRAVTESVLPGTVDKNKIITLNDGPRLKTYPTNAYGKIEFQMDGRGLLKTSKYIRLSDESNMDSVVSLFQDYWKMNEPYPPQFVISVIGNVHSFVDRPEWKEQFGESLVKSVVTANAWLFTGGLNFGLTKVIGEAVRRRQFLISTKNRMIHAIRCIGITKWGCVDHNDVLTNIDPMEMHQARYKVKPRHTQEKGRAFLNPCHTHFLLVDDGTKGICKGTEKFRVDLMHKISATKQDEGLAIPSLLMVLGGDLDSIEEISLCLQKDIPVLLVCGTGDLADVLAAAISCSSPLGSKCDKLIREEDKDLIRNMLCANYKKQLKNEPHLLESKIKDLYKCIRKKYLIHVFEINGKESLDLRILLTAIMHKKDSNLQDQLLLAVKWDRPDVAKRLFPDCGSWPLNIIEEAMTVALLTNKLAFIKLLLKRGIVMRDYLTVGLLRRLYNECIAENEAALALLKDISHKERFFNLRDVNLFLSCLLRKHRHALYLQDITCKRGMEPVGISGEHFEQPFRELFIWAIVVLRTELALFFWTETQKPLQLCISATAFYWRLNACYENEGQSIYVEKKKQFEKVAIGVLEECDKMDWQKTSEILNYRDKYWGNMTTLDLAIMAYDRAFMSTPTCIKVTEELWFGRLETTSVWKLSIAVFNPLLIALGYIRFKPDPETLKELNLLEKLYHFYTCPGIKMVALFYSYMCYLVLFSYIILFDFVEMMGWPEIILHIWVLSLFLDIGKEIIQQPSDPKDSKLMEWLHGYFWNKLDAIWVILFSLGFACRLATQFLSISFWLRLDDVHLIYTFSCILSYIRLYEFYMTMSHIGPKLIVLKRMIGDLIVFFLIVAVCILCYGIGRVALIHRERQPFWIVLKEVVALPYWNLFGEIFLDAEAGSQFLSCETDPTSCHQSPHSWIVPIMLAIYMLIGNILLVNMLIAVFTHIFDEVNKNSREIYFFEIYVSGLQFSRRSVLIPPFLIIEDMLFGFYLVGTKIYEKICEKCCCRKDECNEQYLRNASVAWIFIVLGGVLIAYSGANREIPVPGRYFQVSVDVLHRKNGQLEKRLHRVYIDNLRLFEKEARSKYLRKTGAGEEQTADAVKIDQRIGYLSDLVWKVHQMHDDSKYKQTDKSKTLQKPRPREVSSGYMYRKKLTTSSQEFSTEAEEEDYDSEPPGDFIKKWSKIKKRNMEQQLAASCTQTEHRLSQVETVLGNMVHKLESIEKNVSELANHVVLRH